MPAGVLEERQLRIEGVCSSDFAEDDRSVRYTLPAAWCCVGHAEVVPAPQQRLPRLADRRRPHHPLETLHPGDEPGKLLTEVRERDDLPRIHRICCQPGDSKRMATTLDALDPHDAYN